LSEIINRRKDPKNWEKALDSLNKKMELDKKILKNSHKLKLQLWLYMHFSANEDFDKKTPYEKKKLWIEYQKIYDESHDEPYRRHHYYLEDFLADMMWKRRHIRKELFGEDWKK